VPEVLLSGDHKRIAEWRRIEGERLTRERERSDLLDAASPGDAP
jgi:tRNA (guanine37-N1)-methyltransferase